MSDKWESDSLRWIHAVRKQIYKKTKGKSLRELTPEPSAEAKGLAKKLRLQRVPLRGERTSVTKSKARTR